MASYKPYEMDMITPKCAEKVPIMQSQDQDKRFNSKGNNVEFTNNLEQIINSIHGNTDRVAYNKKYGHDSQRNVENNYDFLTYNKQATEIIANEQKNAIIQKSNAFVMEDSSNMPSTSSGIFNMAVRNKDFDIAMPDLELASKNHISNINGDSDDDIERETAVIMGENGHNPSKISTAGEKCDNNASPPLMDFEKDAGNVKIKQNSTIIKKEIENIDEFNGNNSDNSENVNVDNFQCANCRRMFQSELEFKKHGICNAGYQLGLDDAEGPLYTCGLCMSGFNELKDLEFHVKCEHANIDLPDDFINNAQNHSDEISKVEKAAVDMIINNRFRDVRKLLETSRVFLTSFGAEIIGHISTNLFDRSVDRMYEKIDSLIEKKGDILKVKTNKTRKRRRRREKSAALNEDYDSLKVKKKKKHRNGIKKKSKKVKKVKRDRLIDLGFSSDDDLCLKDRIVLDQRLEDANMVDVDGCEVADEICVPFYAVPERLDGKPLSFLDLDHVKRIIYLLCNTKSPVDFKPVSHIRIKRFEKEANEVIPVDACLFGYYTRKNMHFDDVKLLSELFNDERMLSDELFPHEFVIADDKADIKLIEVFDDDNVANSYDNATNNYDTDYDSYDDGFDAATSHLLEGNSDAHTCTRCTAKFTSKKLLKTHIDEYHGGRKRHVDMPGNYSCDTCGDTFQYIGKLLQHEMKTHSGLKYKYECEVCLKRFATPVLKDGHFASVHNNLAELSCGICKMVFSDVSSLKEHYVGIHKGGKVSNGVFKAFKEEFKSENVDILSATLSKMVTKYSKDSDNAPTCDVCGRKFTSAGRLQQHKSVKHDGKVFRRRKMKKSSRQRPDDDDDDSQDGIDATEFIEVDVS